MSSLVEHHSYRSVYKDDTYTKGKQLATDGKADEGNRLIWEKIPDAITALSETVWPHNLLQRKLDTFSCPLIKTKLE
jgi:hypothetical protein